MTALSRPIDDLPAEGSIELRDLGEAIVRRKRLVLIVVVAVTFLAALYSYTRTPSYTAMAKVLVRPTLTNPLEPVRIDEISLQTEMQIATSSNVAELAGQKMGTDDSTTTLLKHVRVTAPAETTILEFTYADPDPRTAQRGAQAFADAYLEFKETEAIDSIGARTTTLEEHINQLDQDIADLDGQIAATVEGSPEWIDLRDERGRKDQARIAYENQLATIETLGTDAGRVIDDAQLPTSPSHPDHRLDLILGVLLGLVIGVGVALVSERFRDRIQSQASLEQILEAPVLGVIPRFTSASKRGSRPVTLEAPKSVAAEAFRTLRTNLLAVSARPPVKTLLVTSAWMGEGKSTVAANLATAIAQLDRDVVLISADLRFPRVHTSFGLGNDRGLGQVLMGELALDDAILESPVPQLRVLPSGPVAGVAEPVELIQSDKMLDVIARCAEADFVIIDGSPILTVADSLVLSTMVDAVLFVADAQTGRRGAIAQARYMLRQVDARVVGGVMNGGWRTARGGYGAYDYRRGLLYRLLVADRRSTEEEDVTTTDLR
ncbi:MAG TPA: polysaccharide biosynthesis tyrosine autokinase [Actinomycetota bacterium]|nr:polysaccharide biosynthesis tyrosine autokinase [Actinomycetota bacterium]